MTDCQAIMLRDDYIWTLEDALRGETKERMRAGQIFLEALPKLKKRDVSKEDIDNIVYKGTGISREKAITILMEIGAIVRKPRTSSEFWLSIPNVGALLIDIRKARDEISNIIKKRMYHEIPLKELETKRLKRSRMGIKFHIRDMHGQNLLDFKETSVGTLVSVMKDEDDEV
eukprot:CAMPEP_0167744156 /NCGR_PEP_ID=MMETSP0110_2-20121227/2423_1 /TAXON_ID=629695 /ORGANISM="Gymnochlora sp., Strain CCMP2014" /LENGTH=171 /DNA_ID=CAMNT_0007628623 /DNA_START=233 /DNA_END=748 /DNA_ORIENTATION=-